jgi:hypothetical protein
VFGTLPPSTTKVDITSIEPDAVYYAAVTYKVSGSTGDRLVLGPVTAGSLSAAVADGDKGDIIVSGSGATFAIDNDVVTFAKMQNIATKRVIGRNTASSGDPEEVTVDQVLDWISGTAAQGDVFYRGASGIARLAAGTAGQVLRTGGAGAAPSWVDTPGVGGTGTGKWGLAATWTFSTNVAQVDFTGLVGATDILVVARGITLSVSGVLSLRVSTNNGSSYFSTSGDYVIVGSTTGAESNVTSAVLYGTNTTAARTGMQVVWGANITGAPRIITGFDSTNGVPRLFVADNSNDIDAIRLIPSGGGNITGGSIYVFTR